MGNQDLRVVKTVESIENALFALLGTKPIEKITVTELTRLARINKSTFYLHFLDLPDLYKKPMLKTLGRPIDDAVFFADFFDAPDRFMEELDHLLIAGVPHMIVLLQGQSPYKILDPLVENIRGKIYETGRIEKSVENDMKLDMIFGALFFSMPRYHAEHKAEVSARAVSLIRFLFPGE